MSSTSPNVPQYVFTNQTTNANSNPCNLTYTDLAITLMAYGTWDGANITYQTLTADRTTWVNVFDIAHNPVTSTADDQFTIDDFVKGKPFRAVLANAGAGTNLTVTLEDA